MPVDRNVTPYIKPTYESTVLSLVNPQHVNVVRCVALIVGSKFIDVLDCWIELGMDSSTK